MATVKPVLRNKLAPWAAFGGGLTDGQLLSPRGLTSRHPALSAPPTPGKPSGQHRRGGCTPRRPPLLRSGCGIGRRPGDPLLVGNPVSQAAMQDSDQPVPQGPERLVVGGAAGSVGVIATPDAW